MTFYRVLGYLMLALGSFLVTETAFELTGMFDLGPDSYSTAAITLVFGLSLAFAPQEQEADPTKARPSLSENQQESEQEQKK